jgi:hypothetical protein
MLRPLARHLTRRTPTAESPVTYTVAMQPRPRPSDEASLVLFSLLAFTLTGRDALGGRLLPIGLRMRTELMP